MTLPAEMPPEVCTALDAIAAAGAERIALMRAQSAAEDARIDAFEMRHAALIGLFDALEAERYTDISGRALRLVYVVEAEDLARLVPAKFLGVQIRADEEALVQIRPVARERDDLRLVASVAFSKLFYPDPSWHARIEQSFEAVYTQFGGERSGLLRDTRERLALPDAKPEAFLAFVTELLIAIGAHGTQPMGSCDWVSLRAQRRKGRTPGQGLAE